MITICSSLIYYSTASSITKAYNITNSGQIIYGQSLPTEFSALHIIGNKLYNEHNQQVILHGFRTIGYIGSYPGGWWYGTSQTTGAYYNLWNKENFRGHLRAMKRDFGGTNIIRVFIDCDNWRYNRASDNGVPHRQVIHETLSVAEEEGVYVLLVWYEVEGGDNYGNFNPFWNHKFFGGLANCITFMKEWMNELKSHPNVLFGIWNEPVLPGFGSTNWTTDEFMNGYQQIIAGMRTISDHILVINIAWGASPSRPHMDRFQDARIQGSNILYDIHSYKPSWSGSSQSAIETRWRSLGLIDSPVPLIIGELAPRGYESWDADDWEAAESILKIIKKYPINYCLEVWRRGTINYYLALKTSNDRVKLDGTGYSQWGNLCKQYLQSYVPPI
jgi:hypothetical protein